METTRTIALCGVPGCGKTREEHKELNHEFDIVGNLRAKEPVKPPAAISGLDIPLRLLLLDKGIITAEELTMKEVALREQLSKAGRDAASTSQRSSTG